MSWLKVITTLFSILAPVLGPWAAAALALLKSKFGELDNETVHFPESPPAGLAAVGSAPDSFKEAVKKFLNDLVAGVKRPIIKLMLGMVVNQLSDAVLDELWDRLFGTQKLSAPAGDPLLMAAILDLAD